MLKQIDNIFILGTSHVSKTSSQEIIRTIEKINPKVIGIELDQNRLKLILSKKKGKTNLFLTIKEIGVFGTLFSLIAGSMQQKIAKKLKVEPGIDMKTAYIEAKKNKLIISLIDQDIKITLKKFSKMKFSKKVSMFFNLFLKSFKKEYRETLNFDVKKGVPSNEKINELLKIVRKEAPEFYDILIEQRNIIMSKRLLELRENHPKEAILAVVGAGHLEGMEKYIRKHIEYKNTHLETKFKIEVN